MYPFDRPYDYVKNLWCVAAWSHEVTRTPLQRVIMGDPIVFYRTTDGRAVAQWGLCGHRAFPLADGRLEGDNLVCPYHGYTYAPDGACVRVPGLATVPQAFCQPTYPLMEIGGMLWIWMGDTDRADPSLLPPLQSIGVGAEGYKTLPNGVNEIQARWILLVDNLMDLSHVGHLHNSTIQAPAAAEAQPETVAGSFVKVSRWLPAQTPDMPYIRHGFPGRTDPLDVELGTVFYTPCFLITYVRFYEPATASAPRQLIGTSNHLQGVTPATPHTTHGFSGIVRDFNLDDTGFDAWVCESVQATRQEDTWALEKLEPMVARFGHAQTEMSSRNDAGGVRVRRLIAAQLHEN